MSKVVDGIEVPETAADLAQRVIDNADHTRSQIRQRFIAEGINRIKVHEPVWDTLEIIQQVVAIANMLDWTRATPDQLAARSIHLYVKNTALPWVKTASIEQLENTVPEDAIPHSTLTGWP